MKCLLAIILLSSCVDDPDLATETDELGAGWCNEVTVPVLFLPLENGQAINVEEPFVRVAGANIYLYFSDRAPNEERDLHYAVWTPAGFVYAGQIQNVNTPAGLEGAPSIDQQANFYYTNPAVPGMIARGTLVTPNTVVGAAPIAGMPAMQVQGNVLFGNMDIGVAPAHPFAVLSRAAWTTPASGLPIAADLWYLRRYTPSWVEHVPAETAYFLGALNTPDKLEYAPELSADGLTIFYTQTTANPFTTAIMTASRARVDLPFGPPRAIVGPSTIFVEGPTVTPAQDRIFYHRISPTGGPTVLVSAQRCP